jgi:hypothetical protein
LAWMPWPSRHPNDEKNHEQFKWTWYERQKIPKILRFCVHIMCNWEINFETLTSQNKGWTTKVSWTHLRWYLWSCSTIIWTIQVLHGPNRRIHKMVSCMSIIDTEPCLCKIDCTSHQT